MKLRSRRVFSMAAAIMALGTLTAVVTGAEPASAASWTHLCVDTPYQACAYAPGLDGLAIEMTRPTGSTTNWVYSHTANYVTTISQANVDLCMQVDAAASGIVRGAACNGDLAEAWVNRYNSATGRTMFESQWYDLNDGLQMCLGWNTEYNELQVSECNITSIGADTYYWQQFGTS